MSLLLVAAISIGVFASSTLALQGASGTDDAPVTEGYAPFERMYWAKGGVARDIARGGASIYRIGFGTKFNVAWDFQAVPTIFIDQVMGYPTFNADVRIVGAVPLPMGSHELMLRIRLEGGCFAPTEQGGWVLAESGPDCRSAILYLDGEPYEVGDLFKGVRARLNPVPDQPDTWKFSANASFKDPGIPFPIVTVGGNAATTLIFGDFGGSVHPTEVAFISRPGR